MSMDPFTIEAVVRQLRNLLPGAAVGKIHQPGPHDLVMRLWTGRNNLRLLISAAPRASRIHLTTGVYPNPQAPPRFCQLLRSRLCRLLEIERIPGERIVRLVFADSENRFWTLVAELLGPRANLILLDPSGRIVDALLRVEGEGRTILPGKPYLPPEPLLRSDLQAGVPPIPADVPLRAWLLQMVTPMTELIAADIEAAVDAGETAQQALEKLRRRYLAFDFSPCVGLWQGKSVLSALTPEHLSLESLQPFADVSLAADAFYAEAGGEELFGGGKEALERIVRKGLQRLEKRLANIEAEESKARGFVRQRELGDLLLANIHRLRRGLAEVVLDDWYADPPVPVTVPLDPALSPQENAESYFRRHRKGKRGLEHIERRRGETLGESQWLEGVLLGLDEAEEVGEIEAIREELVAARLLQKRPGPPVRNRPALAETAVRQAITPGGYTLFWGRNNRSNDHVSRTLTRPDDLWFHAANMPGCHLVLRRKGEGGDVPEADVLFAAAIAAAHSRGKDAGKVEVMVAEGKWVRKPKGARPGLVTVEHYRTVVVRPQTISS